ncbi:MAG TPA: urease accessory protein UreD [Acetobacteraceae bacterium]|nr:urease accessory protein UreD [Acetobacteraceae bacterium]
MYDGASRSDLASAQRASGRLAIGFRCREAGKTGLARLYQQGCLKTRFPRPPLGEPPIAVLINSSGGVAPGDRLEISIDLEKDAAVTIASQAAERFYRAAPKSPPAHLRHHLSVGSGAALEWLPQESILFDRSALDRALTIDLASDSTLLAAEALVFGRRAMGEEVHSGFLRDRLSVCRAGRPLFEDTLRLEGPIAELLDRPAIAAGARALATILYIGSPVDLDAVRTALALPFVEAGASVFDGLLLIRLTARDGAALRTALVAALGVLRAARPLPRVWLC